jgi:hypothetical protein
MEMYFSGGVSTLVALMAAHRTGRNLPISATIDQGDIARIGPGHFVIVPADKPERVCEAYAEGWTVVDIRSDRRRPFGRSSR